MQGVFRTSIYIYRLVKFKFDWLLKEYVDDNFCHISSLRQINGVFGFIFTILIFNFAN